VRRPLKKHAGNVRFENVPSFIWKQDVTVEAPSFDKVQGDIAFGGAFYFYTDGAPHGLEVRESSVEELIRFGAEVKEAANKPIRHRDVPEINHIYGTIIANTPRHVGSKYVTLGHLARVRNLRDSKRGLPWHVRKVCDSSPNLSEDCVFLDELGLPLPAQGTGAQVTGTSRYADG